MNPYGIGMVLKPLFMILIWLISYRMVWAQSNSKQLSWLDYDRIQVQWFQGHTARTDVPAFDASMRLQVHALSVRYLQPITNQFGVLVGGDRAWYRYDVGSSRTLFDQTDNFSQAFRSQVLLGLGLRTQSHWLYVVSYQETYANLMDNRAGKSHQWRSMVVKELPTGNAFGGGISIRYGDFGRMYFVYPILRFKNKDDTWRFSGTSNLYFSGSIGFKVTYKINDLLRVGPGQSYYSFEFMGDGRHIIGIKQWLTYINTEWTFSHNWLLNVSAGYLYGGNLYYKDKKVSSLSSYPSIGSDLTWRF